MLNDEIIKLMVKSISPENKKDYELSDENEWLVSLYYTIPFLSYGEKISDFHFIKKKFAEEVWTHKFSYSNVKSTDMDEKTILYPADFNCYITDDNNQSINYKYINTYCLKRKKDLF